MAKWKAKQIIEGENEENDNGYWIVELWRTAAMNTSLNTDQLIRIHGNSILKN